MHDKYKDYRKRQVGSMYEAYVAQVLRQEGWEVTENGKLGVHDHGIDLIASKDGIKRYVQCKGFKSHKHVYEDVVSQLFGSVAAVEGVDNLRGVEMYIYSPAQLESYASTEAKKLGITFVRLPFPRLPYIHRYRHRRHTRRMASGLIR